MKIRFLILGSVLSVSVVLVGGLASINPSSAPQSGKGSLEKAVMYARKK